ncbi:MAG: four helix bundle protein [bacterium]|nr:four helix bundle protein [bacterium]
MAYAKCFEELEVWKESCRFVKELYEITGSGQFLKDRDLSSQIRRAGISIASNIAEGFEKGSKKEFIRYLLIARGSAGEVRTQIYIARSLGLIESSEFSILKEKIIHISSMLTKLIMSLKSKSD